MRLPISGGIGPLSWFEVEVEGGQAREVADLRGDRAAELVGVEVEDGQAREVADLRGDRAAELVGGEVEVGQAREVADLRGDRAAELVGVEVEPGHVARGAGHPMPGAGGVGLEPVGVGRPVGAIGGVVERDEGLAL